jgi:hypothetical protein
VSSGIVMNDEFGLDEYENGNRRMKDVVATFLAFPLRTFSLVSLISAQQRQLKQSPQEPPL